MPGVIPTFQSANHSNEAKRVKRDGNSVRGSPTKPPRVQKHSRSSPRQQRPKSPRQRLHERERVDTTRGNHGALPSAPPLCVWLPKPAPRDIVPPHLARTTSLRLPSGTFLGTFRKKVAIGTPEAFAVSGAGRSEDTLSSRPLAKSTRMRRARKHSARGGFPPFPPPFPPRPPLPPASLASSREQRAPGPRKPDGKAQSCHHLQGVVQDDARTIESLGPFARAR